MVEDRQRMERMGASGRRYVVAHSDRAGLAQQYLAVLDRMMT
jgi:hypothetical protein